MCVECVNPKDAVSVLSFLEEGGYSCELYLFPHSAYVQDADDDRGSKRIPVAIARRLIRLGALAVWHHNIYRPTQWVCEWNEEQRLKETQQ